MNPLSRMLQAIHRKLPDRRIGFRMNEVMTGSHKFEPGFGTPVTHFMEFRVTWGTKNIADWVKRSSKNFLVNFLEGTVTIEGLCRNAPCQGTLALRYFSDHSIRYTFTFEVKKVRYRFVGEKVNIMPWNLPWSHTTCFGRLTEVKSGRLVSTSVTHFRLRDVPAFLASLRVTGATTSGSD